jgi:HSP90 family molecular chaperone
MGERIDEWLMSHLTEFNEKQFQSIAGADLDLSDLEDEESKKAKEIAEKEVATARMMVDYLRQMDLPVVTEVLTETPFYPASGRHQQYCEVRAINPRDPKGLTAKVWAEFDAKTRRL